MPTLEEFSIATEYPPKDEQQPSTASADTVSFDEFMGAQPAPRAPDPYEDMPPVWRSIVTGVANAAAMTYRSPEFVANMIYAPQNIVAEKTGWNVGFDAKSLPAFKKLESVAKMFDESAAAMSYRARQYEGETLDTLISKGLYAEAGDYIAQSIVENAPQSMIAIAASAAGQPNVGLSLMGVQTGAQSVAQARAAKLDEMEALSFGVQQGSLEVLGESLGSMKFLSWGQGLFRELGPKAGKAILIRAIKLVGSGTLTNSVEEFATQLGQDLSSIFMGVENIPVSQLIPRAIEAAAIGAGSGGLFEAPGAALSGLRVNAELRDKARIQAIIEQVNPTSAALPTAGENSPTFGENSPKVESQSQISLPVPSDNSPKPDENSPSLPVEDQPTAPADIPEEIGDMSEEEIGDASFDFSLADEEAAQIEQDVAAMPDEEGDAATLDLERSLLEERLAFRKRVGKFRRFADGALAEEMSAIPRSYITRDPNASTIDKKAQELGFESGEALREAIISFERFKPTDEARLSDVLKSLRQLAQVAAKTKRAERKAFAQLFRKIESTLARRLPASKVKQIVRLKTGQASADQPSITEPEALKRSMQRQEQAAREATIAERRRNKEIQQLLRKIKTADINEITAKARVEINALQEKLKKTRTLDGLRALNAAVQAAKEKGKLELAANRAVRQQAHALDREILLLTVTEGKPLGEAPPVVEHRTGMLDAVKGFFASALRPSRLLDWLDGGQLFKGPFNQTFYDRANRAYSDEVREAQASTVRGVEIFKRNGISAEKLSQKMTVHGVTLNYSQAMHIYAAFGNRQNREAIAFGNHISISTQQEIIRQLPAEFKKAADELVSDMSDNFSRIRLAFLEYTDGKQDLDQVQGPYVPMVRQDISGQPTDQQLLESFADEQGWRKAYAERGMTHARKEIPKEYQMPIRLGLGEIFFEHAARREHFIAMGSLVKELQALAHDPKLARAIREKRGEAFYSELEKYVNRLANPHLYGAHDSLQPLIKMGRERAAIVHLGFNLLTMAKTPVSMFAAMGEVGPMEILSGLNALREDWAGQIKFIHARDPQMANRQILREFEEYKKLHPVEYERVLGRLSEMSMRGIMALDQMATHAVWLGRYWQVMKTGGSEQEAIEAAQKAVLRSQPAAAAKDLPSLYASNNEMVNLLLMFTQQMNQDANIAFYDIPSRFKKGDIEGAMRSAVGLSLEALVIWMMSHGRLPEDPDDLTDAALDSFFGMLPLVGSLLTSLRQGYGGLPAPVELGVVKPAKAMQQLYKAAAEGDEEAFGKFIDNSLYFSAFAFKIPYTQIRRTWMGLIDLSSGDADDLRRLVYSEGALRNE